MTDSPILAIRRLTLTEFRNYPALRLETGAQLVALTGANGAGKTNILEAISLLSPGRGLRGVTFDELPRQGGSGSWAIAAEVEAEHGRVSLGTAWSGQADGGDGGGRQVVIDGEAQKGPGALGDTMRLLWLTPAQDRLFAGPASDRRRFLDRMVTAFDPEHAARITVFEKVMRERNLLLEEARPDPAWLSSLEAHMAEAAVAISAARLVGLEALETHIGEGRETSSFPWAEVAVAGEIEALVAQKPAVQVEDEYRRILRDSRGLDRAAGRTLRGPHRSDLEVVHGPKRMAAAHCSTGEQKALLIGLVLAQARAVKAGAGVPPLLLLDEVAAHLDRARRRSLIEALSALGSQSWMTGTDAVLFEAIGEMGQVFQVEDGRVSEAMED
ncbi:DNA replication/repair protein RecF [Aestuariivirga litoralis]|uniref:DNA replication and repair protein RecF n=1 Tax=Aestuariivirga litoralis TaxID=2650924 RepID=A0A2W2BL79_9HYPH|nr:DNA replication/repair protein RecF [Aestuariivirga litoralis]PZF76667.1 DNA replication/repair protein RecF [Aestuariivirga litoralis]